MSYIATPIPLKFSQRLLLRMFPRNYCELPEAPASYKDVLTCNVTVSLSFVSRLKVLVTGKVRVETKTVCENVIGNYITKSTAYPVE